MKPPAAVLSAVLLLAGCLSGPEDVAPASDDDPPSQGLAILATGAGRVFTFRAEGGVSDPTWDFGDGTTSKGRDATHTYAVTNGLFSVVLTGTDASGKAVRAGKQLTVGNGKNAPPVAGFAVPATVAANVPIRVDANATIDPDGDALKVTWTLAPPTGAGAPPTGGHANHGGHLFESFTVTSDAGHGGGGDEPEPAAARTPIDTGLFGAGLSKAVKFDLPGVYTIHCHPHPWMIGKVVVETQAPPQASAEIAEYSYQPHKLRVAPGGTITFKNAEPTPVAHTVTEAAFVPAGEKLPATTAAGPLTIAKPGAYDLVLAVEDGKGQVGVAVQRITVTGGTAPSTFEEDFGGTYDGPTVGPASADYVREHSFEIPSPGRGTIVANVTVGAPTYGTLRFSLLDESGTIIARDSPLKVALAAGRYVLRVEPTQAVTVNVEYVAQVRLQLDPAGAESGHGGDHTH